MQFFIAGGGAVRLQYLLERQFAILIGLLKKKLEDFFHFIQKIPTL